MANPWGLETHLILWYPLRNKIPIVKVHKKLSKDSFQKKELIREHRYFLEIPKVDFWILPYQMSQLKMRNGRPKQFWYLWNLWWFTLLYWLFRGYIKVMVLILHHYVPRLNFKTISDWINKLRNGKNFKHFYCKAEFKFKVWKWRSV